MSPVVRSQQPFDSEERVRLSAVLPLALAATPACGGSVEPGELAGAYALTTVNEAALPYLLGTSGDCDQFIDTGELQLTAAGSYYIEFSGPLNCSGGGEPARAGRAYVGSYDVTGGKLQFETVLGGGELLQSGV